MAWGGVLTPERRVESESEQNEDQVVGRCRFCRGCYKILVLIIYFYDQESFFALRCYLHTIVVSGLAYLAAWIPPDWDLGLFENKIFHMILMNLPNKIWTSLEGRTRAMDFPHSPLPGSEENWKRNRENTILNVIVVQQTNATQHNNEGGRNPQDQPREQPSTRGAKLNASLYHFLSSCTRGVWTLELLINFPFFSSLQT